MHIGTDQLADIDEQMRSANLDKAMSVIVARALPEAHHGLKPEHRRILYALPSGAQRTGTGGDCEPRGGPRRRCGSHHRGHTNGRPG